MGAGHQQGQVVAADGTACLPENLEAWRRLARELLIQTARDAEGFGYEETWSDVVGAKKFFFSHAEVYVWERHVWFGMAGLEEPREGEMARFVRRLMEYGTNVRRGSRQ